MRIRNRAHGEELARLRIPLLLTALLLGCRTAVPSPESAAPMPSLSPEAGEPSAGVRLPAWASGAEALDILEAVFRYQMEHNASSGTNTGRVELYVLSLGGKPALDPPQALLDRLRDAPRPVVPVSESSASWDGVKHIGTDRSGVMLKVERIRRIDESTVEVDGGYYEGPLSASGNTYRLSHQGKVWRVVDGFTRWIS